MHAKRWVVFLIGLWISIVPEIVFASNFGDLPRVLPAFWLALIASFVIAAIKSMKPTESSAQKRFSIGTYFLYQIIGIILSFVLIIVLWLFTL